MQRIFDVALMSTPGETVTEAPAVVIVAIPEVVNCTGPATWSATAPPVP